MSKETNQYKDSDYQRWIKMLDETAELAEGFEQNFVSGNLDTTYFSNRQREVILNLVEKYL